MYVTAGYLRAYGSFRVLRHHTLVVCFVRFFVAHVHEVFDLMTFLAARTPLDTRMQNFVSLEAIRINDEERKGRSHGAMCAGHHFCLYWPVGLELPSGRWKFGVLCAQRTVVYVHACMHDIAASRVTPQTIWYRLSTYQIFQKYKDRLNIIL